MRISDLLQLTWSEIQSGRLHYQMGKTNANVSIPVPVKAKEILANYKPEKHSPEAYVLPYLQDADREEPENLERKINSAISNINKKLKKVAKLAGIEKNLSTHISRHTFGNLAGDKIPLPMLRPISKA